MSDQGKVMAQKGEYSGPFKTKSLISLFIRRSCFVGPQGVYVLKIEMSSQFLKRNPHCIFSNDKDQLFATEEMVRPKRENSWEVLEIIVYYYIEVQEVKELKEVAVFAQGATIAPIAEYLGFLK